MEDAQQPQPPAGPSVQSVQQVLSTIQGVLSIDAGVRNSCEALLRTWEADAVPGFLISLMQIVEYRAGAEEPFRLVAAVIAKNAVGSSWRKTLGTREWSRVPPEEQTAVRNAALQMLLTDPSDRVALQLSLLLANVARFDFPARAPDLLEQLIQAAVWDPSQQSPPPPRHLRALKALHHVLTGLSTKRFVVETPRPGTAAFMDLRAAAGAIAQERQLYTTKLNQAAAPLTQLFIKHCQAFLSAAPEWQHHGVMAKATATCLADRLGLTPQVDALPEGATELLQCCHTALGAIMMGSPPSLDAASSNAWQELGGKVSERICRVVIGHLDTHAIAFAEFVAPFLQLFVSGAVLSANAAAVHRMRPKRRVLLVRFIAKALLSPYYRSEWTAAPIPPMVDSQQREQLLISKAKSSQAQDALEQLLGSGSAANPNNNPSQQCALLTEAVISKYIALSPEELQEWQEDPEGYARSMEVESGPDAETPRPIGVGLLLCMLERGGEPVVKALLGLAARVQAMAGSEATLLREATYRCIGEGFGHVGPHIAFSAWYAQELQPMLSTRLSQFIAGSQPGGVIDSVLQARALWLVGVCATDLRVEEWGGAFQMASAHMGAQDLVVALSAVSACLSLCSPLLDDQAIVDTAETAKRRAGNGDAGAGAATGLVAALRLNDRSGSGNGIETEEDPYMDEKEAQLVLIKERINLRLIALTETATQALQAAFSLLSRLSQVESMVRVLQLISVLVEVMDTRIKPQLPIIAAALPQIWQAAAQHASLAEAANAAAGSILASSTQTKMKESTGNTGAVVRLHSALLAVLTHLVGKLKGAALSDPQVAGVVFPLLKFATSLGSSESECLVDEAFRLWSCTLSALPEVPPQMVDLLPNLAALMRRGRDAPQVFPLIEGYLLLGAGQHVIPMLDLIQSSMLSCIHGVETAAIACLVPPEGQQPAGLPGQPPAQAQPRAFAGESAAEALATSALADVMLQLSPAEVPSLLAPTFSAMLHFICNPQVPALGCDARLVNCEEGFLEVLARVFLVSPSSFATLLATSITAGPPGSAPAIQPSVEQVMSVFLDKWLTIASHTYVEETLGVKTMAMLGRYRRRIAVAALHTLITTPGTCPRVLLNMPAQITRVAALAIRALTDDAGFHADQVELDNLDFKGDLSEDRVLARRLVVTRSDPVRALKVHEAVRALLNALSTALGGTENLMTVIASHATPRLLLHINQVLSGDLQPLLEEENTGNISDDDYDTVPNARLLTDLSD